MDTIWITGRTVVNEDSKIATSGINIGPWLKRIEVHGISIEDAEELRDKVMKALSLSEPEIVATVLCPAPADERDGVWFSSEDWKKLEDLSPGTHLYSSPPFAGLKDHEIRAAVNQIRDVAVKYAGTQQLREQIASIVVPLLRGTDG